METSWYAFTHPNRATLYLLYTSLWTGEVNATRKQNSFSAVLFTEGPVVGLCWAKSKPKRLKGPGVTSTDKQSSRLRHHADQAPVAPIKDQPFGHLRGQLVLVGGKFSAGSGRKAVVVKHNCLLPSVVKSQLGIGCKW